jgi:protein-S-isoprenylcysteine O-methyltransferase Ste14
MKLLDHFTTSGDALFRGRSHLPLLLLPVFVLAVVDSPLPVEPTAWSRAWQLVAAAVAFAGLAVRVIAIGTAPAGTSERSTTNPRASELRTTGLYSVVRHPLYVGNTLIALGLACAPAAWYLPVIVLLAALLYYERIAAREEAFLEGRFGESFRAWTEEVPAMIPRLSHYVASRTPFLLRKVLGREFHALLVIGAGFFVLDVGRLYHATGRLVFDSAWSLLFLLTAAIFIVCSLLKKHTSVFKVETTPAA